MAKTSAEFLSGLKKRIVFPANQELLNDDALLEISSDVLQTDITKILKASRQNYLLTTTEMPIVQGQSLYDVPYRSVVGGLEEIKYKYGSGNSYVSLVYVTVEDIQYYQNSGSTPEGFYFQGDQIAIVPPQPSAGGSLALWYHRRLSRLTQMENCGKVLNISGNIVTVDNAPPSFMSGLEIDFIKSRSMPIILEQDAVITNVVGTQLTFLSIPPRLVIGDYVAPAGYTPIIPLMDEASNYFEGVVGSQVLTTIGDYEGSQKLMEEVKSDSKDLMSVLEPRIDGEPEKIVNYHGLLRQKTWRPFGFFRR